MNLFANNDQSRSTFPLFPPLSTNTGQNQNRNEPPPQNPPTNNNPPQSNPQTATNSTFSVTQPVQQEVNIKQRKFKWIYKQIEQDPQWIKIIQKQQQFKRAMSQSLEFFDITAEKTQEYQRLHSKKQNFGFGIKEMSDQCRNMNTEKIDMFWKTIVDNVSQIWNVSQLIIVQYLSQFLIEQELYTKKITTKQFYYGNQTRVLDNNFIGSLYRNNYQTNEVVISTESQFYLQVFEYLQTQIYLEQVAMLKIIQYMQRNSKRFFREIIKKQTCDFFTVLWRKYKQFSESGIKKQTEGNQGLAKKIKEFFVSNKGHDIQTKIRKCKISLGMQIGVLLFQVLDDYGSWRRQPFISALIQCKQAIKFIDEDLHVLVQQVGELPKKQYQYVAISLDLLLKIVPMCCLYRSGQGLHSIAVRQVEAIRTALKQTKSQYLQCFRFLIWSTTQGIDIDELQRRWLKIPKTVQWMMISDQWSQWIAIVLNSFQNHKEIMNCELFLNQVVKMLKNTVDLNIDQFWSENCSYQLRLIRNSLTIFIHQKDIKHFLPVLIKCLGNQTNKLQYSKYTLELIGFDGLKRIRDTVMQILDSNQNSSSLNHSMFYSNNNQSTDSYFQSPEPSQRHKFSDNYPEQQIKFLCNLIRNCKQDLSIVQSSLFECQMQFSTGILVSKFLLECLAVLNQYKPSALKCMRYIVLTIDVLFTYEETRPAIVVAISLSLCQQWGEKGKNQLYDMASYVCLKPSASQEYRQCSKLKKIIAHHVCNIVRTSKYISEYFPVKQDLLLQSQYAKLHSYIFHKNYPSISEWFYSHGNIPSQPTPWLYTLLLTLQSSSLLPIDYQSIRFLIHKFLIDKEWTNEYQCIKSIKLILNQTSLIQNIISILQPKLNQTKNITNNQKLFLFGICNLKYDELIQSNIGSAVSYREDQPFFKIKQKQKRIFKEDKQIVIGNIAGSLQLISTVLNVKNMIENSQHNLQACTELLSGLKLYQDIKKLIGSRNTLYQYKVTLNIPPPHTRRPQPESIYPMILSSQETQPTISINILQVICSYLNFESRYSIPHVALHWNKIYNNQSNQIQISGDVNQISNQQTLHDFSLNNNLLCLDSNELTMKTDHTIGIGSVFRVINQILIGNDGDNKSGGGAFLYRCLVYHDYKTISEEGFGTICSQQDFSMFMRQIINMLEWIQMPYQVESVFQFLTLAVNKSNYFLQQLIHHGILLKLRKIVKIVVNCCTDERKLYEFNKIGLFALAISQYRQRYREDIEIFIKFPTNLVQDMLDCLIMMQGYVQRCYNIVGPDDISLLGYVKYYRKLAYSIIYKGTLHVCLQLLKRFYPIQSMTQNVEIIQLLIKLSDDIVSIPATPETDYLMLFKQKKSKNQITINEYQQICIAESELSLKYKLRYGSLASFVGFLPSINQQYGRNYQFYGAQIYAKSLYAKFKLKTQAEKLVLNVYKINYQTSLLICHQQMLISYVTYLLMINTTGQFGHILTTAEQDRLLTKYDRITQRPLNHNPHNQPTIQILNFYKYQTTQNIQGSLLYGHTIEQNYQSQLSLISVLIQYFEKDHSRQYINDIILYGITSLICNLKQYWYTGNVFLNKFKRLVNFVFDSTQVRFKVSPRIFTLFMMGLVEGYQCCRVLRENSMEQLQQIVEIIQTIVLYGGTLLTTQNRKLRSLQLIYNQKSLQQNMFLISGILIKLIQTEPSYSPPAYNHILAVVANITNAIIDRYLTNFQLIDLNNMCIMKLINVMLTDGWDQISKIFRQQPESEGHGDQIKIIVSQIGNKYGKYLVRGLKMKGCEEFLCFMLSGLKIVHEFGMNGDVGCWETVMQYMGHQFNQQVVRNMQPNYDEPENYSKTNWQRATIRKQKLTTSSQRYAELSSNLISSYPSTLSKIVQLNQLLLLLGNITDQQLYWTNRKYSSTVESIFNSLINQTFIYKLTEDCGRIGTRILQSRIAAERLWQQNIEKICIDELQGMNIRQNYNADNRQRDRGADRKQGKKTNMFEFILHVQICHSLYFYVQVLTQCLDRSESLRRFYSKMLNNKLNFIDQLVWQKLSNSFLCIIEYLKQKTVSFIRFYPKSLKKLLIINNYIRHSTDIGHNSNFINIFLGDAGTSSHTDSSEVVQQYKSFIMDLSLSFCNCVIKFVEIWKSYDWKSNVNWVEARNKIINHTYNFYRQCCSHVSTPDYWKDQEENISNLQKWFNQNQVFLTKPR